jgi:hypothetical protein
MSQEYYSVLARTISAVAEDHAQLRSIVYSLARMELRKELRRRYKIEFQEQTSALENAITKIESDFIGIGDAATARLPSKDSVSDAENSAGSEITIWRGSRDEADAGHDAFEVLSPIVYPDHQCNWPQPRVTAEFPRATQSLGKVWWRLQIVLAAIGGLAIYLWGEMPREVGSLSRYVPFHLTAGYSAGPNEQQVAAVPAPNSSVRAQTTIDGVPLPTSYGIYAVSGGKLIDVGLLPIKVPDPRVAISAMISSPSETVLPDGHVQFIVFRRDLLNDAPDRVVVRVVAQVIRALTFAPNGKAALVNIDGTWAVRGNSYDMKVAPVDGRPEMITIRPAEPSFAFPAGRYALVLKRAAYDFTVEGPVTDLAHCLERTDAVGAPIYSECRKL